jgi:hypothetical protein
VGHHRGGCDQVLSAGRAVWARAVVAAQLASWTARLSRIGLNPGYLDSVGLASHEAVKVLIQP